MIAEVGYGLVDTSIAGFGSTLERHEIVDFSPMIEKVALTLMIKTPKRSDNISYLIRN